MMMRFDRKILSFKKLCQTCQIANSKIESLNHLPAIPLLAMRILLMTRLPPHLLTNSSGVAIALPKGLASLSFDSNLVSDIVALKGLLFGVTDDFEKSLSLLLSLLTLDMMQIFQLSWVTSPAPRSDDWHSGWMQQESKTRSSLGNSNLAIEVRRKKWNLIDQEWEHLANVYRSRQFRQELGRCTASPV